MTKEEVLLEAQIILSADYHVMLGRYRKPKCNVTIDPWCRTNRSLHLVWVAKYPPRYNIQGTFEYNLDRPTLGYFKFTMG
jgi:hypothetical protein